MKDFIKDSYACIKGRGVHQAINKLHFYMKKIALENLNYYILKCDVSKYFYSVDHELLYGTICKRIKDRDFLRFTRKIIFCNNEKKGIPIGNYTSQYFANIFLNRLDKYIKEELKIRYYVRYMDDFVILLNSKEECKLYREKIEIFLDSLKLKLNPKTAYFKNEDGVNFCGYKLFNDKILLKNKNKTRLKRWFRKLQKMYSNDEITLEEITRKIPSIRGYLKHCKSYRLYEKMIERFILSKY